MDVGASTLAIIDKLAKNLDATRTETVKQMAGLCGCIGDAKGKKVSVALRNGIFVLFEDSKTE